MRRGIMVAAVLTAGALGLAGCGQSTTHRNGSPSDDSDVVSSSAPPGSATSAQEVFLTASDKLATTSARFEIIPPGGSRFSGVMDMAAHKALITFSIPGIGDTEIRIIEPDMYVRGTIGPNANKWVHTKVNGVQNGAIGQYHTFEDTVPYLKAVSDVTQTSPGHYSGTVDMHKVAALLPSPRREQLEATLDRPGVQAQQQFEATVDGQGRLSTFTVTVTVNGKPAKTELRYYDYGAAVDVAKPPAAQTIEG